MEKDNTELLVALLTKLDKLNIHGKQLLPISQNNDLSDVESECSDISKFQNDLSMMEANKINFSNGKTSIPMPPSKYYYSRPTPQHLLFEKETNLPMASFSASTIYEWNIDGHTEYQIIAQVHRMFMYANVCKAAHNGDKAIAEFIVAGFTGQLRGWWENVFTPQQRDEVLNAIKIIHTPSTTKNEQDQDIIMQHTSS